ncbi:MAG: hypothetical protein JW746_03755 [Candidatus Krumholzibacteriota bacterium]|nr:hypothetical protein [Candidatus Krumholzibacteriota bacterium]
MLKRTLLSLTACVVMLLMVAVTGASAQNILLNPGFENGPTVAVPPTDWESFGNAYQEAASTVDYRFVPFAGNNLCSMYGNWSGAYNVSGIFQEFSVVPGDMCMLSSYARHWGGDAMIGSQATGGNWVVQKIAFFNNKKPQPEEIASVESIILDGSFAQDVWHYGVPICALAPAEAVTVQAMILYIQVDADGGAANIDDVYFCINGTVPVQECTWGALKALKEKE